MTTTRNGVEFYFPQIQEGATDLSNMENNNVNFKISPIAAIDGYEGETMNVNLSYVSVYNYLNLALKFDKNLGVENVQKIVVSAIDKNGDAVAFPTKAKIKNENVPVAKLSINGLNDEVLVKDWNGDNLRTAADYPYEIADKVNTLRYTHATKTLVGGGTKAVVNWTELDANWNTQGNLHYVKSLLTPVYTVPFLVVDCDATHTNNAGNGGMVVNNEDDTFSTYMLMPAGMYKSITLDIYTNKGVYTKTVDARNYYMENTQDGLTAANIKGEELVFLAPNVGVNLADVEEVATDAKTKYLKITAAEYTTDAVIVTKTADLINLINGITAADKDKQVTVVTQDEFKHNYLAGANDDVLPEHSVVINQAVMDAVNSKEASVGDILLTFTGDLMKVVGNANAENKLNIHDFRFEAGCDIVSGYVKSGEDITVVGSTMTIKSNANVEFSNKNYNRPTENVQESVAERTLTIDGLSVANFDKIENVVNEGTISVTNDVKIYNLTNEGTVNVESEHFLRSETLVNASNLNVYGLDTENNTYKPAALRVGELTSSSNITNNGNITVLNTSSNSGKIVNAKVVEGERPIISIQGIFSNTGRIENDSKLIVEGTGTGALNNTGIIVNDEFMYCYGGNNTINNTGTIYANGNDAYSTTYITTNSTTAENVTATNAQKMGTIVIENRNQDVSVTTDNRKGYIQYAVTSEDIKTNNTLSFKAEDKFNKVVLTSPNVVLNVTDSYLKYVVVNSGVNTLKLCEGTYLELDINSDISLLAANADKVKVSKLTIGSGKLVKIPTENLLYVYSYEDGDSKTKSKTNAQISNNGELLVGGNFWTNLTMPSTGKFASGDGNSTAFHWGQPQP